MPAREYNERALQFLKEEIYSQWQEPIHTTKTFNVTLGPLTYLIAQRRE